MDLEERQALPLANLLGRELQRQSLSLGELARRVREAARRDGTSSGATRQTAHNWCNGQTPRPDSLRWIATALGLPIEDVAATARRQDQLRRHANAAAASGLGADDGTTAAGDLALDHASLPPGTLVTSETLLRQWADLAMLGPLGERLLAKILERWRRHIINRRTVLKALGASSAAAALALLDHPLAGMAAGPTAATSAEPLTIEPITVGVLESLALRYQRLYHSTPPTELLIPVTAHLELVEEALHAADHDWQRRGLHRNRSQVALLAGRLSFFDLHDSMAARGYYGMALESAREAADRDLAAGVLGHMSFIPAAQSSFRAALDDLAAATRLVVSTSILSSWLPAVASEVHANAGAARASLGAVARAEDALGTGVEVPVWLDYYDATRLYGFKGYALLAAGQPAAARDALSAAVTGLDASAVKQRTVFLADQATSFVLEGEVDEGCRLAGQAAEQLASAGYATSTERLREFRALVAPWQDRTAVKDLDERLARV